MMYGFSTTLLPLIVKKKNVVAIVIGVRTVFVMSVLILLTNQISLVNVTILTMIDLSIFAVLFFPLVCVNMFI